jgi:hypothetical protein
MALKSGRVHLSILVALFAVAAAFVAWWGAHELFVDEYGVHYARGQIDAGFEWHGPRVTFSLNTPTLCGFAALAAGLFSLYGAGRFYLAAFTPLGEKHWIRYLVYQGLGFTAAVVAALIYMYDFFTTAFDGVG